MIDIKMSAAFELPIGDGEFTLVAMSKSTYVSMDKAAVIAINSYDANQERIAELEKERDQILKSALDSESNYCDLKDSLPAHNLEQQAKGIKETATEINNIYVKEQLAGKLGVNQFHWWCLILGHMNDKAKALKEGKQ